MELEYSVTQLS